MSRAPLRVGVLGGGTVGREVVAALVARAAARGGADPFCPVLVGVAVRDVDRAAGRGLPRDLLTDAPAHLVASAETDVIVELMGGDEPARTLIAAALGAGKSVVTANKHVIAHHGAELEAIARRTGASLRFEASVGGGIPVLGPLAGDLAANHVTSVRGIVNGTTNHILSAMADDGRTYDAALREAQARGYAESDPTGDVGGHDAVNKIVILARLAFGGWLDPAHVPARPPAVGGAGEPGIGGVTLDHVRAAAREGLVLKLLARAERSGVDDIDASVLPTAVLAESTLGRVSGVRNRIEIVGDLVGSVGFDGPGAGGVATSSAVLGDLRAIASGAGSTWAALPPAGAAGRTANAADRASRWFVPGGGPDAVVTSSRTLADLRDELSRETDLPDGAVLYPVLDD